MKKMANNGYIKLFRKLKNWEWYQDQNTKSLFIHCLLSANKYPDKWRGKSIKNGTFITSYQKLADELGLSVRNIRTAIKHLKSTNELTVKTTNKYTVIKVENWPLYQDHNGKSDKQTDTQDDNQLTNKRQTNDNKQEYKRIRTNKTLKERNIINNITKEKFSQNKIDKIDWKEIKEIWNEKSNLAT